MPPPATIDLPEEDEKKSIDELIKILEAQKRRDIRGILRRPEGQAVDEPLMQQVVEEDEERKEEKRRKEMEGYEKPDPELTKMRQSLRSPLFTQQIPEMTGAAQERAREMLKTEEGEISSKPYEGQSAWESFLDVGEKATRVIKKTAGLDYLFEWLMPEEEAGIVAGETRKGIGGIAGLKVGLDAQKLLPHPALKAAAPVVGMIGGAIIGKAAGGETMTLGEYPEMATYGAGYGTMLTQVKNLGIAGKMLLGGTEAGTIGYVARQSRSLLDEGKVLPISGQWKALVLEVGLGAAIGPFIKMKPGNEIHARYTAKNKEVLDLWSNRIDLLRRQLKKPYGSKFQTTQARTGGHKLMKTLRDDMKIIEEMPEVLFDLHKNPELSARLVFLLSQENNARLRRGKGVSVDGEAAFADSINYLNELGTENYLKELLKMRPKKAAAAADAPKESYEGGIQMFNPKEAKLIDKLAESWDFLDASDMPRGKLGKLLSAATGGNFHRLYHGMADVFETWARKSGAGENHFGHNMAKALRSAVVNGDNYSAGLLDTALAKANKLNYNTLRTRKETRIANQEYAALGDSIDTVTGLPRDVREGMTGKGVPGDMGTKEGGHVPLRPGEDPSVTSGEVGENMRIARSRAFYNEASPMGRALIEGWNDASRMVGAKMKDLEIVVIGEDFERALKNPNKKNRDGTLKYEEELKVMREAWNVKTTGELLHKYNDYLKSQKVGDPHSSNTGELFSHLERAKTSKDYPAVLRDWGPDLGNLYLERAARRVSEIEQFGQTHRKNKAGEMVENPDYIFNRGYEHMDESTRNFIKLAHRAVFESQSSRFWKDSNRFLTVAMIANKFSALKNTTGIFKTWLLTENKAMAKATGLQIVDSLDGIAQMVKGSRSERPNTALARIIGITRNDVSQLSQMINDTEAGLTKQPLDITGMALKFFMFTPAENAVRRTTLQAFQFERGAFMQKYDDNPEASRLVDAIWKLHHNPKSKELRDAVDSFTGRGEFMVKRPDRMIKNRALAIHARFLSKMGINMNKMSDERFAYVMGHKTEVPLTPKSAPETMRYLQNAVHETQGGYRYDQLPVFMQEANYRVFTKFMSWSMQMQRQLDRHVVSEVAEGNLAPAMKLIAGAEVAGEAMGVVSGWFGRDREDASYAEIAAVLKESDYGEVAKMLLVRGVNNLALGGQWNLFGDMVGGKALRIHKTGKLDKPGIPALDWWQLFGDAMDRRINQGGDDEQFGKDLRRLISGIHRTEQLATEMGLRGERKKEWQDYESLQRQMKGFSQAWESADYARGGLGKDRPPTPSEFVLSKHHGFKRDLRRALVLGEVDEAKRLAEEHIQDKIDTGGWIQGAYNQLWDELKFSVRASQPLKMGSRWSKENQESMIKFMERRNWPGREELLAHQDRYIRTAIEANLLPPESEPSFIETEAAEANRINGLVQTFADTFYNNRKGKMSPQRILGDAKKEYGYSQIASSLRPQQTYTDPESGEKKPDPDYFIGGKRGWPFSPGDSQYTREGQAYSLKAFNRIKGHINTEVKNKMLRGIWLEPEFLKIPNEIGRANYIQKRWDELGINEAARKEYMIDLQKLGLSEYVRWMREEKKQLEEQKQQKK